MDETGKPSAQFSRRQVAALGLMSLGVAAPVQAESTPPSDEPLALRKLVIVNEMREMRARYGWHAARGDYDRIADLFAPEGMFEVNLSGTRRQFKGRETIRAFLSTNMTPGMVFPFIHNDTVDVADDCLEAMGTCAMESNPHGRAGSFSGYYHDRAALIDGRWQFTERRYFFYAPTFERSGLDMKGQPETGLAGKRPKAAG